MPLSFFRSIRILFAAPLLLIFGAPARATTVTGMQVSLTIVDRCSLETDAATPVVLCDTQHAPYRVDAGQPFAILRSDDAQEVETANIASRGFKQRSPNSRSVEIAF